MPKSFIAFCNGPVFWTCVFAVGAVSYVHAQDSSASGSTLSIRFIDSATGYALRPETISVRRERPGVAEQQLGAAAVDTSGRAKLQLERGHNTISAVATGHRPMSGVFDMGENNQQVIHFLLDPLEEPLELRTEYIASLQRPDATTVLGFIVDDDSGQPLEGVQIISTPSGAQTVSDTRGFFQMHIPLQSSEEARHSPASLIFHKPGYGLLERQHLELFAYGDWIYRIRLERGHSPQVIDERQTRRRPTPHESTTIDQNLVSEPQRAPVIEPLDAPGPLSTAPTNSTVRVPRNIRVLRSDGVTIDYVTLSFYTRSVLPSEWIASWGSATYPGGTNSLNAGAVAVRCYAIAKLNNTSTNYDICATTSCQVYNPNNINSLTDVAVNFTANWVLIGGSGAIASTEYSAENNSIGFTCGDSFTSPSGGCIYDPVCAGETRAGHGRGMCQWGSAKWATGRKFLGNVTGGATLNGYPRRDWAWIVQHYYPTLTFVKGAPLIIGDDVKAVGTVNVRACADGSITNGVNCPAIASKASGSTGVIIGGPVQVTNDLGGYTWYQIQWNDASSTTGWSVENFIERVFSTPSSPVSLVATAISTNQINLSWSNSSGGVAAGFKLERAIASGGPWLQLSNLSATVTNYQDRNLFPASTWFYRVRAYNAAGNSAYSGVVSATTSNVGPVLGSPGGQTVVEGTTLNVTNPASGPDFVKLITDFEPFTTELANGVVLFREPRNSGSTTGFIDVTPNLAAIKDVFSTNGNPSTRALRINCNFTNATNPWLRLTTAGAANFPNPVIDFTKRLRLSIYADKAIRVAVGCRETTTAGGTAIGSDGGTTGSSIEWAGVTNVSGTAPMPTRTVTASNWTTVVFDLPNEPIRSFTGGNNVLSTASGLGVLEHLAIVPAAGNGIYNIYIDNVAVVVPRTFTYTLGPGAPTNASISVAGIFSWTPLELQGPGTNPVAVIATDNSAPPLIATNLFTVTVLESNLPPTLAAITDRTVHAGTLVTITNSATDADLPLNTLAYNLEPGAPAGATINSATGLFEWVTTTDFLGTNAFTVRVTDNGQPALSDTESFSIIVMPKPTISSVAVAGDNLNFEWNAIAGRTYRVQYRNDLNEGTWNDIVPDIIAAGSTGFFMQPLDSPQRFYRVLVLD